MVFSKIQFAIAGILVPLLLAPHVALSVMESETYQVDFDSVNFGGGYSSSTSYQLQDTGGEIATGNATSTNYEMRAGYQQMNTAYIAINGQNLVDLGDTPGIVLSNVSTSTTINVVTDSYGGYQLTVRASTSPAMTSGSYYFADYTPAGPAPDYTFGVDATASEFGYAVSGTDVVQRYKNNGSACNAGSSSTANTCWDGFSTTPATVAERHSSNHPAGTDTVLYYQAGIGSDKFQEAGEYGATIVVTATAL